MTIENTIATAEADAALELEKLKASVYRLEVAAANDMESVRMHPALFLVCMVLVFSVGFFLGHMI
jgi:hypothetical protein